MDDVVECPNCKSGNVRFSDSKRIATGDGTPVLAVLYDCLNCQWTFIHNELMNSPSAGVSDGG